MTAARASAPREFVLASVQRSSVITVSEDAAEVMMRIIDQFVGVVRTTKMNGLIGDEVFQLRAQLAKCVATRENARVDTNTRISYDPRVLAVDRNAVMDTDTAARRLNMTADTVRWHCRKQHLQREKVGGRWWISVASVDEFAEGRNI